MTCTSPKSCYIHLECDTSPLWQSPGGILLLWVQKVKRSVCLGGSLEKGMTTHSDILGRKIPRTEEPGRLQSTELQRLRPNWAWWGRGWVWWMGGVWLILACAHPASPLPLLLLEYKVGEFEMLLQKACGLWAGEGVGLETLSLVNRSEDTYLL